MPCYLGICSVMMKAGFQINQAYMFIIFANVLSFLGVAFGIAIGSISENIAVYAELAVSGAFLYIGLGQLLPIVQRLIEKDDRDPKVRKMANCLSTLAYLVGILICWGLTFIE